MVAVTKASKGKGSPATVCPSAEQLTLWNEGQFCGVLRIWSCGGLGPLMPLTVYFRVLSESSCLSHGGRGERRSDPCCSPSDLREDSSSTGRLSLNHPAPWGPTALSTSSAQCGRSGFGKQKPRSFRLAAFCPGTFLPRSNETQSLLQWEKVTTGEKNAYHL